MDHRYHETSIAVPAPIDRVFAYLDDHARLSSHMRKPSWQMGGGRMLVQLDGAQGKAVGSRIRLAGRVWGIPLAVDEVVTERRVPTSKVWETVGVPRLLVIGSYRMGFQVTTAPAGSLVRVFIEYQLPVPRVARCLGCLLGRFYAAWCTERMAVDARRHFQGDIEQEHRS